VLLKDVKRIRQFLLSAIALGALVLAACQPQIQPAAVTASGVTMAEAQSICSTLAVARNTPDFNILDAVLSPSVVTSDPFSNSPMTSLDQLKQFFLGTQSSFPDFSMRYDDIWVSGDRVIAHWTATGTQNGMFFDIEATGKNVTISGISVMKVESGKVTEQSSYFDLLSIARQLGARLTLAEAGA
jgi:steroid delta-isomerase-like uncharacterized protein